VASKRRLPVLQSKDGDDSPPRPRWEWIVFGALLAIVAWLPLAGLALVMVARVAHPDASVRGLDAATSVLPALSIILAFVSVGYVLGRWGRRGPGDAVASAALATLLGIALTWARFGVPPWEGLLSLLLAVPSAFLGASVGVRRQGSIPSP
jgi:hypothetical protein